MEHRLGPEVMLQRKGLNNRVVEAGHHQFIDFKKLQYRPQADKHQGRPNSECPQINTHSVVQLARFSHEYESACMRDRENTQVAQKEAHYRQPPGYKGSRGGIQRQRRKSKAQPTCAALGQRIHPLTCSASPHGLCKRWDCYSCPSLKNNQPAALKVLAQPGRSDDLPPETGSPRIQRRIRQFRPGAQNPGDQDRC